MGGVGTGEDLVRLWLDEGAERGGEGPLVRKLPDLGWHTPPGLGRENCAAGAQKRKERAGWVLGILSFFCRCASCRREVLISLVRR